MRFGPVQNAWRLFPMRFSLQHVNDLLQKEREFSRTLLLENFELKTKIQRLEIYHAQRQVSPTLKRNDPFSIINNDTVSDSIEVIQNGNNVAEDNNKNKRCNDRTSKETEGQTAKQITKRRNNPDKPNKVKQNSNKKNQNVESEPFNNGTKRDQTKKLKVLVVGDSQLRFVDESKLTNAQRDVSVRFQPGMKIKQAVKKAGKSDNDVIIIHAATNDLQSTSPDQLSDDAINTLRQVQENNPKAHVALSSILRRKDNHALNAKAKKVNEVLAEKLALSGFNRIDNSNILFSFFSFSSLFKTHEILSAN